MSYKPLADSDLHPNTRLTHQPWTDGFLHLALCKMKCVVGWGGVVLTEESQFCYLYDNHHIQFTMYWGISPFIAKEGKKMNAEHSALNKPRTSYERPQKKFKACFSFFSPQSEIQITIITCLAEYWSSYISKLVMFFFFPLKMGPCSQRCCLLENLP